MPPVIRDARPRLDKPVNLHAEKFRNAFNLAFLQPHISRRTAAVAATKALEIFVGHAGFTGLGMVRVKSVLIKAMKAEMEKSTP